jgi:alpha-beta hydrolase superfamily lysophospholipase
MSTAVRCEAFFFGAGRGARFCLLHEPAGTGVRGSVLYLPPFAEEQNRARRAASVCARQLAAAGWTVLQMDLGGCGDSAGDFADATWAGWIEDLRHGITILGRRARGPLWLWAVRAGALLAADLIKERHVDSHTPLLLWQPVLSGAQHLKQFLRMRAVRATTLDQPLPVRETATAEMGGEHLVLDLVSQEHARSRLRGSSHQLRADWICGKPVEVAGYTVSPALAFALDRAVFELPPTHRGRVVWLECVRAASEPVAPASQVCVTSLTSLGLQVNLERVVEEPFWQTTDTAQGQALVASSVRALGAVT